MFPVKTQKPLQVWAVTSQRAHDLKSCWFQPDFYVRSRNQVEINMISSCFPSCSLVWGKPSSKYRNTLPGQLPPEEDIKDFWACPTMMSYAYHEYVIFKDYSQSTPIKKSKKGVSGENVSLPCKTIFKNPFSLRIFKINVPWISPKLMSYIAITSFQMANSHLK